MEEVPLNTKRPALRAIVKSNCRVFGHIKLSGRGRTNNVIIQEINDVIRLSGIKMQYRTSSLLCSVSARQIMVGCLGLSWNYIVVTIMVSVFWINFFCNMIEYLH